LKRYVAVRDTIDFELIDDEVAVLVHMLDGGEPPTVINAPQLLDGSTIAGCWQLAHWDSAGNVSVYYSIESLDHALTEDDAAVHLAGDQDDASFAA
jgi:hypothetical protein